MDTLTPEERSERMGRVRGRDTKLEMLVRQLTHRMGYRYRLQGKDLPGKPDIIFRPRRKAIFVHGCFWHRHPKCKLARLPKSHLDFWAPKLEGNRERDLRNQESLKAMGWRFLIIWECETGEKSELSERIRSFLSETDTLKGGA